MAPLYDLMLMLDSSAPEEQHDQVVQDVRSMIESGGELVGAHDWGTRGLSYEIDHRHEAGYHLFQFHGSPELLDQLHQSLRIKEGVLRFRVIRLKPGTPPPPTPDRESPRRREEAGEPTVAAARAAADAPPAPDSDDEQ